MLFLPVRNRFIVRSDPDAPRGVIPTSLIECFEITPLFMSLHSNPSAKHKIIPTTLFQHLGLCKAAHPLPRQDNCTILNFQSANPVHLFQRDFALETIFTITRNQHPAKSGVRVISFRIISDLRLFFPYPLQKNRCERLSSQRKRASPASGFESYRYLRSPQRKRK